jgi:RNA polymerase sigma factor (sigma-70 family)
LVPRAQLCEIADTALLARLRALPEAVHSHLEELPEREQRILALRFWGNLTQADIGGRLGISQMHASRLLSHALAHLRDRLTSGPAGSEGTAS